MWPTIWAGIIFFLIAGGGVAIFWKFKRVHRIYVIAIASVLVEWVVLGPYYEASILKRLPAPDLPSAPHITSVQGAQPGSVIQTAVSLPTSTPAATPTPEPPALADGTVLFDKPTADSDGSGKDPVKVADADKVSGAGYEIIGRWGDYPYSPLCPCIQVRSNGLEGWVWRSAIPLSDEELSNVLRSSNVINRKGS